MKIHVDKQSEVSAHEQLREQIIFLISTGALAIGAEMPGVRALSRQLGISLNTISKVYAELVRGGWLVEQAGTHHKVVERKGTAQMAAAGADAEEFIESIIHLAHANGLSLEQLVTGLRRHVPEKPPDHFLIVEPDPGLGALMRGEISDRIGYAPATCSFQLLQENPALAVGAVLVAPIYLVERLGKLEAGAVVAVSYSPMDEVFSAISRLSRPSMIGWVSVSQAGLKTMSGIAAPAIGELHSSHLFLLEGTEAGYSGSFRLRRYRMEEYRPVDVLKFPRSESTQAWRGSETEPAKSAGSAIDVADLRCMDLLVCDTIAASVIRHAGCVRYQLLTHDSLERIEAISKTLPKNVS